MKLGLTCKVWNAGFSGGLSWLHGRVGSMGACVQLLVPLGAFQGTLLHVCITRLDMTIDVDTPWNSLAILPSARSDVNPNMRSSCTCNTLPMPCLQLASVGVELLRRNPILQSIEHSDARKRCWLDARS